MPHKFNADRRDKIPKQKQRVTNWSEYNEGLRRRGDLTVWISDDALELWAAPRRTTPDGQPYYSDLAIELCLTLGMVFKLRTPMTSCDFALPLKHPDRTAFLGGGVPNRRHCSGQLGLLRGSPRN